MFINTKQRARLSCSDRIMLFTTSLATCLGTFCGLEERSGGGCIAGGLASVCVSVSSATALQDSGDDEISSPSFDSERVRSVFSPPLNSERVRSVRKDLPREMAWRSLSIGDMLAAVTACNLAACAAGGVAQAPGGGWRELGLAEDVCEWGVRVDDGRFEVGFDP